jgi:chromosome segregation ATPase
VLNKNSKVDTRVAILEEKFSVYEQMMTKMESAIHTISEAYQGISRMLAIHEEKIENNSNSDSLILQTIKELDSKNTVEHQRVMSKIEQIEEKFEAKNITTKEEFKTKIKEQDSKIEGLVRFRLLVGGAILVIVFAFTQQQIRIFENLPLTNGPATLEKSK